MKKLITTDLGGQPVYFKDFEFVQEMIRELASSTRGNLDSTKVTVLNSATFDLSTDGYTLNVLTAGWAYYAGEYFYIPVHSSTGSGTDVPKWNIVETYDSRGLKTFSDAGVGDKEVYLVRQLQVSYVPPASGGVLYSETEAIPRETDWVQIAAQSPWTVNAIYYRLNALGDLDLYGYTNVALGSDVDGAVICVLPEGFRPNMQLKFMVPTGLQVGIGAEINIKKNGEITYHSSSISTPFTVTFNQSFNINTPVITNPIDV